MRAATAPAPVQQAYLPQTGAGGCDLSAAYDPEPSLYLGRAGGRGGGAGCGLAVARFAPVQQAFCNQPRRAAT